jgi:LysM repeat protein
VLFRSQNKDGTLTYTGPDGKSILVTKDGKIINKNNSGINESLLESFGITNEIAPIALAALVWGGRLLTVAGTTYSAFEAYQRYTEGDTTGATILTLVAIGWLVPGPKGWVLGISGTAIDFLWQRYRKISAEENVPQKSTTVPTAVKESERIALLRDLIKLYEQNLIVGPTTITSREDLEKAQREQEERYNTLVKAFSDAHPNLKFNKNSGKFVDTSGRFDRTIAEIAMNRDGKYVIDKVSDFTVSPEYIKVQDKVNASLEPEVAPAPAPEVAPAATPVSSTTEYTVKPGDYLIKIAKEKGIKNWREIYNLNKKVIGPNPNIIKPGQVLQLPIAPAPAPAPAPPAPAPAPAPAAPEANPNASGNPEQKPMSEEDLKTLIQSLITEIEKTKTKDPAILKLLQEAKILIGLSGSSGNPAARVSDADWYYNIVDQDNVLRGKQRAVPK